MKRFLTLLAAFSLIAAIGRRPAIAGILMLLGVGGGSGGGGGPPAWVPAGAQVYVDFVNNRAWDQLANSGAGIVVTPASLLTDARSASIPYDPGTGITSTVAANALPIGSAGLQVFQVNNLLGQSNGDYTTAGAVWTASFSGTGIVAPTITKNPDFGSTGCTAADTAPDGSCNTTEITIPPITTTNAQSSVQQHITGVTAGVTYTCYVWMKNSAAVSNPQLYLFMQQGAASYGDFASAFVQPSANWQRFSVTGTLPAAQTSLYFNIGSNTNSPSTDQSISTPGGTIEAWVSGCSPGAAPAPYVATTTASSPTVALDNITATGDLATALEASAGAVSITTAGGGNGVAGTMLDDNGTVFIGKSATDAVTTALGAALSSPTRGTYSGAATAYLEWSTTAGAVSLNGAATNTDATSRSPGSGPFHIGTTSGTSAPLNAYVASITVYNTARAPVVASSVPITSISFGTVATLSSGALQGAAPSTYVNGDSWSPTVDASGNIWTLCNDCGWGTFSGSAGGDVILSENTWSGGNHGYFNLGNLTGGGSGVAGLINSFSPSPLGGKLTQQSGTTNTWKSHGLIAITDGANTDLFAGLTWDAYAPSAPWIQVHQTGGSVVSVVNPATNAATTANWSGMPTYSGGILPASPATFTANTFGSPTFIQYPASYCGTGPDGSASYLYAISNDLAWNTGSNVYLARTPCATILTSLGGSPAAASVAANWQFYDTANTGCSGTGTDSNCWTSALASATPIFTLANRLGVTSMSYVPVGNRYLLSSWYYPSVNGPKSGTQTQTQMAGTSNFVFADCDKPWHCTSELPEVHWPKQGYYDAALVMSSLSTDGGLTGSMIWAGNFSSSGNSGFSSAATYTPTLGQITVRY
jgi:hypothetical protein